MKNLLKTWSLILVFCLLGSCTNGGKDSASKSVDYSRLVPTCYQPHASNPILKSGDLFTGSTWNDPSVLKEDGTYIMYASSDVNFSGDVKIYRLTSIDGINWVTDPMTPVLSKSSTGQWDDKSVETPSVVKFNGLYHMFYTGYQTNTPTDYKIGHATSSDGVVWSKNASNPILSPVGGAPQADIFNQFIVAEPGAVVFNNTLYVYFAAQGYITTADGGVTINDQLLTIGLVKSADGVNFSSPQRVLDPNQNLFPRNSGWKGYSTPASMVMNDRIHLFVDVLYTSGGSDSQYKLFHVSSANGESDWVNDSTYIFDRLDSSWTNDEIRAPSVLYDDSTVRMWFAGHSGVTLGIGEAICNLK